MLARLLREIGIELAWLDAAPDTFTRRLSGGAELRELGAIGLRHARVDSTLWPSAAQATS